MAQKIRKGFFKVLPWSVVTLMIFTLALGIWQSLPVELAKAASLYGVTEAAATVGAHTSLELEYTVDADVQTWAAADTLTIQLPANYPQWGSLTFTAEVDQDVTNDATNETAITAGLGNGQYSIGGDTLQIKWGALAGNWVVVDDASTIRILITAAAIPLYADATSTFTWAGTTADGGDTNPSGTDNVNVSAAVDITAAITLGTNSVVGASGTTTITLTTPFVLDVGDEVLVTFPDYIDISGDAEIAGGTIDGGTATVITCDDTAQVLICTVSGASSLVTTGTITLTGITSKYVGTDDITVFEVEDEGIDGNEIVIESTVNLTNVTAADAGASIALSSAVVGATTTMTLTATPAVALAATDTIVWTMPAWVSVTNGAITVDSETFGGAGAITCVGVSLTRVITCTTDGVITAAQGTIVMSGMTTNYAATGTNAITDLAINNVATGAGADISADTTVAITTTTAADVNASVVLASPTVGATGNTTITLTLPVALDADDTVEIVFPAYVNVASVAFSSETFAGGGTFSGCAAATQTVTCTAGGAITAGTGTIVMTGITSYYVGTTDITDVQVEDENVSANDIATDADSTVALTNVTAATLQATVTLGENVAGNLPGVTTITIVSGLPFALDQNDTIDITFPSFIDISGPAETATGTFDNSDAATISCDDNVGGAGAQVLTCTVTNAASTLTTGTIILQNITSGEEGTTDITVFQVEDEGVAANDIAIDEDVALTNTTGYTALTGNGNSNNIITASEVSSPNGGETWTGGSSHNITWLARGTGISKIKLSYSLNGGSSYPYVIAENEANDGTYAWTVPNVTSSTVKVKVEALSSTGSVITSDISNANFSIAGVAATFSPTLSTIVASPTSVIANGTATTTVTVTAKDDTGALLSSKTVVLTSSRGSSDTITPATTTTNASGVATFTVKSSTAGMSTYTATVNGTSLSGTATVSFTAVTAPGEEEAPTETPVSLSVGDLIKSSLSTSVYYYGSDNKRHLFPNEKTYKSWYADWSSIKTIPVSQLQGISLGKNVTVRPGTVLLKIETDPKVYAVEPGGLLRWVPTEARALALYGSNWNTQIIDVPLIYWVDYSFGSDITSNQHPTGTLIQYTGTTEVYYVQGSEKRHFTGAALEANKFQTKYIETIPATISYTNGTDISGIETALVNIY